jgi:MarR family transcriptional regulator for hemolysin
MAKLPLNREFAATLVDAARMLRTYVDQVAREFGMSRAQWVVLTKAEQNPGLKQSELAEMLDLAPISLTRLIDRLADSGLIERKPDPNDRRANRLFLTPAAKPLLERLNTIGNTVMETVLAGLDQKTVERMVQDLGKMRANLRSAIARNSNPQQAANG